MKTQLENYPQIYEKIIYFEDNQAISLYPGENHPELAFNQVEADTMMLTAYANIRQYGYSHQVVIDTEDTYVYVQAAYVSQQVEGDLFIRRKSSFVICSNMLPENIAKIIIPAHVITGTGHTSGFFGHGKKILNEDTFS